MLRFHFDEHVSHAIARGLRRRGIDVTTTTDAGLRGADDVEHIAFALAQQRVVMTHDSDFLVEAAKNSSHAGIAYCPPDTRTIGHIVRCLCLMSDCLEPYEMFGKVEFL